MTPEQKTAVANLLKADLTSLSHQRLIELCILYEATPEAHDIFPAALKTELERRFTAAEIAKNDTLYAVLQKKANTYQSAIPLFHQRLLEMAGTVNRDIWFTDNKALFESAIADADVARWLVKQHDILEKCLGNRLALAMLAESTPAATAILSEPTAVALWKNTPDLWDIWPQHAAGMTVIAKSAELTQYIIDTPAALAAVIASDNAMQPLIASATARRVWVDSEVAMTAVAASQTAMTAVAASQTAMTAVVGSEVAMRAVAGSEVAMRAVAGSEVAMRAVAGDEKFMRIVIASSVAMAAIAASETGKRILIAENQILQSHKDALYSMVKQHWTNARSIRLIDGQGGVRYESGNSALAEPNNALIFVCLGSFSTAFQYGRHQLEHPDGSVAALGGYRNQPSTMQAVDGVSFAGAKIKQTVQIGGSYAEVWIPKV